METCPLEPADVPGLVEIDPSFVSDSILEVHKRGAGATVCWELSERRLAQPFDKGRRYDLLPEDLEQIAGRIAGGNGLYLKVVDAGRIVALLDLELVSWNNTAFLWNILLDRAYRRRGIGRRLFERAIDFAREHGARAIILETQNNNMPACRFYQAMGCDLVGLNDLYYSNQDLEYGEVALFWAYRVDDSAPGAE